MPIDLAHLPNIASKSFDVPDLASLAQPASGHRPRILLLYGSVRERSFSRLLTMEAARLLEAFGADTRIFNPSGLPLPDDAPAGHHKIAELRALSELSEGQVWSSPERHGAMTGIMKAQIDSDPLDSRRSAADAGQDAGGHAGEWRIAIVQRGQPTPRAGPLDAHDHDPDQSSVAKAYEQFDGSDRMKPSPYYDRVVDVMEELVKFTLLTRDASAYLTDRYSERREAAEAVTERVRLASH